MSEQLLTVKQPAEHYNVAIRTLRRWLAEAEIEPDMLDTSAPGKLLAYYKLDKCDTLFHICKLFESLQQALHTGIIFDELQKTRDGRATIELMAIKLRETAGDITIEQALAKVNADLALLTVVNVLQEKLVEAQHRQLTASNKFKRYEEFVGLLAEERKLEILSKKMRTSFDKQLQLIEVRQKINMLLPQIKADGYDCIDEEDIE
jgi:hypothetical protein